MTWKVCGAAEVEVTFSCTHRKQRARAGKQATHPQSLPPTPNKFLPARHLKVSIVFTNSATDGGPSIPVCWSMGAVFIQTTTNSHVLSPRSAWLVGLCEVGLSNHLQLQRTRHMASYLHNVGFLQSLFSVWCAPSEVYQEKKKTYLDHGKHWAAPQKKCPLSELLFPLLNVCLH